MKLFAHRAPAFSLVEVTLALGVAAFCLIAVFGLMPVGVQTNRNATSQTGATNVIAAVTADLRATSETATITTQYRITFGTSKTLFFDGAGECSVDANGSTKLDGTSWDPPLQTRYRLNISFPQNGGLTYADIKVTWPAAVDPATTTPSGSVEMFAAFDRN
jgi:type II secretory pathway pseudopilin PulG